LLKAKAKDLTFKANAKANDSKFVLIGHLKAKNQGQYNNTAAHTCTCTRPYTQKGHLRTKDALGALEAKMKWIG